MSPFDKARYERLLEGLEAVEIWRSELNAEMRIDAQYFRRRYLQEDACRRHFENVALDDVAFITDGPHGYHEVDDESPIAMLTAKCAKGWFADRSEADRISAHTHNSNLRSSLKVDDLILSTRGTVGLCAIVERDALPSNIDQDVARIALNQDAGVKPTFLLAYLNCSFGQDWMERNCTGMVQQGLSLARVRELPVPLLSDDVQAAIAKVVESASYLRRKAKESYESAETALLRALGLVNWQTPEPLSYVRSSRDAFSAGRLDAEHFQPRFDRLLEHIEATGQSYPLADLLTVNQRGKQPDYGDSGLPVVNSKHVNNGEVRIDADNRFAIVDEKMLLIELGDVLINGTGVGTIGRAATYLHSVKSVPDNHVTVLRPTRGIDPVYLSVFLNSLAGQMQVEQRLHGSSGQIELYPNDIAQFSVWLAPATVQTEIRKAVQDSFEKKQQAGKLLEAAKRAVEIAIEESEAAALEYLADVEGTA
ncbi:MAG: restriction endonuclease subunit S [Pseudomonadota bacterium]